MGTVPFGPQPIKIFPMVAMFTVGYCSRTETGLKNPTVFPTRPGEGPVHQLDPSMNKSPLEYFSLAWPSILPFTVKAIRNAI
jgi:hypothetical protein